MRKQLLGGVAIAAILAGPALAADFPVKRPIYEPVFTWTGFYAGLQAGYGWSNSPVDVNSASLVTAPETIGTLASIGPVLTAPVGAAAIAGASTTGAVPGSFKTDPRGSNVGFLLGYDLQLGHRFVAGIEADLSDLNQRGSQTLSGAGSASGAGAPFVVGPGLALPGFFTAASTTVSATTEQRVDWLGTVRGRLGLLVTESFLVYATGGLAYGRVEAETNLSGTLCATVVPPFFGIGLGSAPPATTNCGAASAVGSLAQRRFGSAVGAGLQYALSRNWSVKTEYIHWDLGRSTYAVNPLALATVNVAAGTPPVIPATVIPVGANIYSTATARFNGDIVRLSVNYKFD